MLKERYVNIFTDFGFKKLFGTEVNKDIMIDFLNVILKGK
ncbi:MAG: PD-(D/E)XK nuclease family transposase, partial [Candidatus Kapabacteria bacterium]|nr:PD-(D/E)XK nuclease family transposase [Candidatus Kapabacteria bacterium]